MSSESPLTHVLFCVADQWRGDVLGALGTAGVHTPNLDALAADGVLFTNHWCQASPCGPSRRSLLTGTQVSTHGQWTNDEIAAPDLATLAGVLRSGGVEPALVGYTDTPQYAVGPDGHDPARWRELVDPDFEIVQPFIWQHGFPRWSEALRSRGYQFDDHTFGPYRPEGFAADDGLAPAHYAADDSDVTFLTDAALDDIGRWSTSSPRLLHVNWLRPHPPMTPPRPYHRLIDPGEVSLPRRPVTLDEQVASHPYFAATVPDRSMTEYLQRRSRLGDVGEREDRMIRAAYYGLCAEVDHHVGRLVSALVERGLLGSTLIIFVSDHGEALGDHWLYGRRGPFDGHFRVPCIIRDPRVAADETRGSTVDDFTTNTDLFPTICDAIGLETPSTVEGRSLIGHLRGEVIEGWRTHVRYDMSWHDHLSSRSSSERAHHQPAQNRFSVIRSAEHRLVEFPDLPAMLFDLNEDPEERTDRSRDPALGGVRRALADLLRP